MSFFKKTVCGLIFLMGFCGIVSSKSLAQIPYIGLIKEVHKHYKGGDLLNENMFDLVNDYVFYSNKGNFRKCEEISQKISTKDLPCFLPWDNVDDKKYQFLFNLDYNEDLDSFDGNYTKKTNKIPKQVIKLVHAYEWYSAGIKKFREKLRLSKSTKISNAEIEYLKKSIIIMHQERKMISDDLIQSIACWNHHGNYIGIFKLDFYTSSLEWNEKAREVNESIEQIQEQANNIVSMEDILHKFSDKNVKTEVAKLWGKHKIDEMTRHCKNEIEKSRNEEYRILKVFIEKLKSLTPLAPNEEKGIEEERDESCSRFLKGCRKSTKVPALVHNGTKALKFANETSAYEATEKLDDAKEDPDDLEIIHKI